VFSSDGREVLDDVTKCCYFDGDLKAFFDLSFKIESFEIPHMEGFSPSSHLSFQ
jgi:hypothetical protein